ncbi:hypothetical protein [Allomesorhizobium camelthorni]|uniref:Uncharacterized protein n=1 Tax=Allomesorhizobium camelthorni TaxID=475069 RepID=A0A6G4WFA4_9HYPH|nr:hypothetical protein [Mesorhizobium camelthorni]NGO53472.1 hypothetical protein [Mesorhizobium camelthorni]
MESLLYPVGYGLMLIVGILWVCLVVCGIRKLIQMVTAPNVTHSTTGNRSGDNRRSTYRNPYIDPTELRFRPHLNNPQVARRIEECAGNLHNSRQNLAKELGRKALTSERVEHGHNSEFLRSWKAVCEVVRAKYGEEIVRIALEITGYREPSHFDIEYGHLW